MEYATPKKLADYLARTDLKLKPTPLLKQTFVDFSGEEQPVALRYYQIQGVLHLMGMPRFMLGDDMGLGKTIQCIVTLCHIWAKDPSVKVMVLTTKSATRQWVKEFSKFTQGVRVVAVSGTKEQRAKIYAAWSVPSTTPSVLVMGYRSAVLDYTALQDIRGHILIADECTVFKNHKTQVHQVVKYLAAPDVASRAWGLSGTLIKNHLMEGYGIYKVLVPELFGSYNQFVADHCIVEMMPIGRGRKVPKIVGYRTGAVARFRAAVAPWYLGRPKHAVAAELPTLTRKTVEVGLSPEQEVKYKEAVDRLQENAAVLTVGETRADGPEEKEVTKLTALIYCQEIVDHLGLIECEGESEKLDTLIEMLTEGDLEDEKVIVFTRFRKMVDILMPAFEAAKIKAVRVTGVENETQRQAAQDAFQNPEDATRVICITMAGGDAINLQAAKAIVFYDSPWSAGDFLQILGRMIRIGSKHDSVLAIHLVTKWSGGKTIDEKVMSVVGTKMKLVEAVLGKRLKSENDVPDEEYLDIRSDLEALFMAMKEDSEP